MTPARNPDTKLRIMDAGEYDAIILGAGHNGLVLQAYLAKAGLKTISLDRGEGRARATDAGFVVGFDIRSSEFDRRAVCSEPPGYGTPLAQPSTWRFAGRFIFPRTNREHAPVPGGGELSDLRRWALSLWLMLPSRRQCHGATGIQRGSGSGSGSGFSNGLTQRRG